MRLWSKLVLTPFLPILVLRVLQTTNGYEMIIVGACDSGSPADYSLLLMFFPVLVVDLPQEFYSLRAVCVAYSISSLLVKGVDCPNGFLNVVHLILRVYS
jgi:hypothetical protein